MVQPHAVVVDDRPDNAGVLAELLALEGVTCTQIYNPFKVENALQNLDHVEVFFLDLEMPGMDGYALYDTLKDDSRFHGAPVVAYTVHVSEINTVYQMGFHSFLGKPLDSDLFPDQLARILRGERVWATP